MRRITLLMLVFGSAVGMAWGELGHQLIGRVAAKLVAKTEPGLAPIFGPRWLQQGHLANMPDIYWRNLDGGVEEDGRLLGDDTHFLNPEQFMDFRRAEDFFKVKIPLDYQEAKAFFEKQRPGKKFYHGMGTIPWRAQQLADLYKNALEKLPAPDCKLLEARDEHPTKIALAYAGILSHFTGDASQPFHVTADYDGAATGEKGIHGYFETQVVDALEDTITPKVFARAEELLKAPADVAGSVAALHAKALEVYGDDRVSALILALVQNSYSKLDAVRELDKKHALLPGGKRKPASQTAPFFENIVVERLAVAAALTADIWKRTWVSAGKPQMCWSWQYALKPFFLSPTDDRCFGYALKEDAKDFKKKDGSSALPWKKAAESTEKCLTF